MDALETYMQNWLFCATKLEQYIAIGVYQDIDNGLITKREGEEILRLGKLQTDMPGLFNRWLLKGDGSMPLNKVILYKDVDKVVPIEILQSLTKDYNKYLGMVGCLDGNFLVLKETTPTAEKIFENLEQFSAIPILLVLGNESLEEKDIQPFPVIVDGENVSVYGFLQGDPSSLSDIIKRIQKLHKLADSFEDFWNDVADDEKVKAQLTEDHTLLLVNNLGGVAVYESGSEKEHEWGWSYSEANQTDGGKPAPKPADGPKDKPSGFTSTKNDSKQEPKQAVATQVGTPPVAKIRREHLSKLHPSLSNLAAKDGTIQRRDDKDHYTRCPAKWNERDIHANEIIRWYEQMLGWVPDNAAERPLVPHSFLLKNINAPKTDTSAAALKTADNKPVAVSRKPDRKQLDDLNNTLKGLGVMEEISNPETMHAEDEKIGFFQLIGVSSTWNGLPHLARLKVIENHPAFASEIWGAFQARDFNSRKRDKDQREYIQELENAISTLKADLAVAKGAATPVKARAAAFASTK